MELTEDEIIENCAKQCMHCTPNSSLLYEYEKTCSSCRYNVSNRNIEL